jgi:hypothetical protein
MRNDSMNCEIKGLDGGVLYVSFDYIDGTSSVDWSKVASAESTQLFVVKSEDGSVYTVSVRLNHIDSYKLLAAQAVGVSSGSRWMDELASPGRTAARYSRTGVLSRRQVSTMERIAATRV